MATPVKFGASFRDVWQTAIYPKLQEVVEELRFVVPRRLQSKDKKKGVDVVHNKLASCIEDTRKHKCRRAVMLNLAWTRPADNTQLQEDIPLSLIHI